MGKYFGTDGIRGIVNKTLDAELAFKAGQAAATVMAEGSGKRPLIIIGKDTRISSDMFEAALVAGICSAGGDVMPLGVLPTPAVAYLTVKIGADMGIVISASHNSYEHNGIKMFNCEGYKLSDEAEAKIEQMIDGEFQMRRCLNGDIGKVINDSGRYTDMYIDYLAGAAENEIKGLKVAVDCSNGASYRTAQRLFSKFPIVVNIIHDSPNGININDNCGSTHLKSLQREVVQGKYDLGIAFDGDADRCLVVDEKGNLVDGDRIMAVCGCDMKKKGRLKNNAIVATVMSNMGFHVFAKNQKIELLCAPVGDRNVLEMMKERGCNLGGEQSGHLIFLDDATTGDGQLAAVKFLGILSASGKTVSELVSDIPQYPQVLLNVPIEGGNIVKNAIMQSPELKKAIEREESILGENGRILVRPSGTEALIRVMVEAKLDETANSVAGNLTNLIKSL